MKKCPHFTLVFCKISLLLFSFLLLPSLPFLCLAQTNKPPKEKKQEPKQTSKNKLEGFDLDAFIQDLFPVQDDNINYADAYETLFQLYTNPLDLNEATREELKSLYVLSEIQINSLLAHREKNGKLLSVYELQAIENFDYQVIKKILPFIEIDESNFSQDSRSLWQRILAEENRMLMLRTERDLQTRRGYKPLTAADTSAQGLPLTRYGGDANKVYLRLRTQHSKDFSIGFTAEKDAGETFDLNKKIGFDFTSFHIALYNRKKYKALLIGDYQLQIGQGLLLSAGFALGKGAETVLGVRRSTLGLRPYTSVLETGFMRGIATTLQVHKRITFTPFLSYLGQDAALQNVAGDTLSDTEDFINSLQITGLHRTEREVAAKNQVMELTYGGNLNYTSRNQNLELGITFIQTNFSVPIIRKPRNYNQYEFTGSQNHNIGGHFSYNWQNFNFFGEGARSASGGIGAVGGFVAALTSKIDLAFVYRNYDKNFHTFYGNAFSENTRNINETGVYWGLKYKFSKKITFAAYFDKFSFPWLKFLVDSPTQGYEYLVRLSYTPNKTMQLYAQFREENKGRNLADNPNRIDFVVPSTKRNLILNADWTLKEGIFLRSRVQMSSYTQQSRATTSGFVIAQDAVIDHKNWQFSTRFAIFDTDDFDNRQYVFEKNVLYAFSIPAYYGRGFRNYYMVSCKISKKLTTWLRYAYTSFRDTKSISSGLETIDGSFIAEVTGQVIWKF